MDAHDDISNPCYADDFRNLCHVDESPHSCYVGPSGRFIDISGPLYKPTEAAATRKVGAVMKGIKKVLRNGIRYVGWSKRFYAISYGYLQCWSDDCLFAAGEQPDCSFRLDALQQSFLADAVTITLVFGECRILQLKAATSQSAQQWLMAILENVGEMLKEGPYSFPVDWDLSMALRQGLNNTSLMDCPNLVAQFQRLIDHCWRPRVTRDRKHGRVPQGLLVAAVESVQNVNIFRQYQQRRLDMKALPDHHLHGGRLPTEQTASDALTMYALPSALPQLDNSVNERWLFHGTTYDGINGITAHDFCMEKSRAGTMYGHGIYTSDCPTKADEYSEEAGPSGLRGMLLCKVALGNVLYDCKRSPCAAHLRSKMQRCKADSILGDREKAVGTFREFVVFDHNQIYPSFIIWYKHKVL